MKINFNGVPHITPAQYDVIRRQLRMDGWKSALSGVGYASFDKRETVQFEADIVSIPEARDLWRGDALAARIIETVPSESVREGFKFCAGEDNEGLEIAGKVMEKWKKIGALQAIKQARCFERAYGGGAILMGLDDGQTDYTKPLNIKRVRSFDFLTWLEPDEIQPLYWYSNPFKPKYGQPAIYQLSPYSPGASVEREAIPTRMRQVHESRLIVFHGIQVSRNVSFSMNGGFGDNLFTRCRRTLRDFNMSWSSASVLVMEFATPIFKMKGLDQLIAMDRDDEFKRRIQAAQLARSVLRAMLIDAEEEFTREQTPVAGIPELLDRFATRLAADADMPVTLLMGQSPAGLNATGESDIRFFYDRTKGSQCVHEVPALEQMTRPMMAAEGIKPPKEWSIEPNPLWQPSEKEQADTRKVQADTDAIYLDRGVLSPKQVQQNRFTADGGSYSTFLEEDVIDAEYTDLPPDVRQVPGQEGAPALPPGQTPAALPPGGETTAMVQFNGAQIQAAYNIIAGIGKKEIPRESARQMLTSFLGVKPEDAAKMAIDFTAAPDPSEPPPPKPAPGGKPPFEKKEKMDGWEDQERDELGRWGEGGGGALKEATDKVTALRAKEREAGKRAGFAPGNPEWSAAIKELQAAQSALGKLQVEAHTRSLADRTPEEQLRDVRSEARWAREEYLSQYDESGEDLGEVAEREIADEERRFAEMTPADQARHIERLRQQGGNTRAGRSAEAMAKHLEAVKREAPERAKREAFAAQRQLEAARDEVRIANERIAEKEPKVAELDAQYNQARDEMRAAKAAGDSKATANAARRMTEAGNKRYDLKKEIESHKEDKAAAERAIEQRQKDYDKAKALIGEKAATRAGNAGKETTREELKDLDRRAGATNEQRANEIKGGRIPSQRDLDKMSEKEFEKWHIQKEEDEDKGVVYYRDPPEKDDETDDQTHARTVAIRRQTDEATTRAAVADRQRIRAESDQQDAEDELEQAIDEWRAARNEMKETADDLALAREEEDGIEEAQRAHDRALANHREREAAAVAARENKRQAIERVKQAKEHAKAMQKAADEAQAVEDVDAGELDEGGPDEVVDVEEDIPVTRGMIEKAHAHAERARAHEATSKAKAAAGDLRGAAAEAKRAAAAFKTATKSATSQESRNEGKARRARERREAKKLGITVEAHRASKKKS